MKNSFQTRRQLTVHGQTFDYHSLPELGKQLGVNLQHLPFSHRVLLENLLRFEDGVIIHKEDIEFLAKLKPTEVAAAGREIQFRPARVLLQDFTGVPVIADLAAIREAVQKKGGAGERVNPLQQVDLVIDHSVQVDVSGVANAEAQNTRIEFERNHERYRFLKWGQQSFRHLRIVPPATGICHQINMEILAAGVWTHKEGSTPWLAPDSCIGTDSHTPMVNSLGVVGWGVGGIEAESVMLGQPISLLIPPVIGVHLTGKMKPGLTATDLVLTITQMLRKQGVVGQFVEFFGEGLTSLSAADRATISNMSPEYGATIGFFAPDSRTLDYFKETNRTEAAHRVEAYYRAQEMWDCARPEQYYKVLPLDLAALETSLAGPSKPHERVTLDSVASSFQKLVASRPAAATGGATTSPIKTGDVVIAAITSCTNTSNPRLMIASGLVAQKALAKGLRVPAWVKTSFAPGSRVVVEYLSRAGLMEPMEKMGFGLVGYGCTTCIGNSGPLRAEIADAIQSQKIATASVLSGNRNFEARIHPLVLGNYLASPPLVVIWALAGNVLRDLRSEPVGHTASGDAVFLADLWPNEDEITRIEKQFVSPEIYKKNEAELLVGDSNWRELKTEKSSLYPWESESTYLQRPPFLEEPWNRPPETSWQARLLAVFGDFITTDHISPAGSIGTHSPAGQYLQKLGVSPADFNSYGSRRGNHHVMVRGTFANVRIKNQLVDKEGGFTRLQPENQVATIFDAAEAYRERGIPLVVFAGQEYGSGSSRDWAAKGTRLLGVRAVVAQSFERIHRSNLIGMGVLPLELPTGTVTAELKLDGTEMIEITGLESLRPRAAVNVKITSKTGTKTLVTKCRIDTENELAYYRAGGLLPYVVEKLARPST